MKSYHKILIGLVIAYVLFIGIDTIYEHNSNPEIYAPKSTLTVSVKDKDKALLEGIKAKDKEDGDLTDEVFIESISEFNSKHERKVNYIVIDKDNGIARTTRKIKYSDYEEPKFFIKKPLVVDMYTAADKPESYVGARSVVDGNISDKVSLESISEKDSKVIARFYVKDSCGVRKDMKLRFTQLNSIPNIRIKLDEYMLEVEKGTDINPEKYIEYYEENGIKNYSDFSTIRIRDNYNKEKEGIYEFIYDIRRANGDYGLTKLVVVVN